jgi:hypothetical protein
MSSITVPLAVAPILRRGLIGELALAAHVLDTLTAPGYLDEFRDECTTAWAKVDAAHALLGQIGAVSREPDEPVDLELGDHAATVYEIASAGLAIQAVKDAGADLSQPVVGPALQPFLRELRREAEISNRPDGGFIR